MNYPAVKRFDFHKDGNAYRRDRDARPANLLCSVDFDNHAIEYHPAGDEYIRSRPVGDVVGDLDCLNGFTPFHAMRIGIEMERTIQARAADVANLLGRVK